MGKISAKSCIFVQVSSKIQFFLDNSKNFVLGKKAREKAEKAKRKADKKAEQLLLQAQRAAQMENRRRPVAGESMVEVPGMRFEHAHRKGRTLSTQMERFGRQVAHNPKPQQTIADKYGDTGHVLSREETQQFMREECMKLGTGELGDFGLDTKLFNMFMQI